jgi:hypothetical protein
VKFYSAEDIEALAAQGKRELILDDHTALTDLARDVARQFGIVLIDGSRPPLVSAPPKAESQRPVPKIESKPKGCQHGPLQAPARSAVAPASANSNAIVDRLVGMVKQIGKRSDNGHGT